MTLRKKRLLTAAAAVLALCLIMLVGWLSPISLFNKPAAPSEPIHWHEMGDEAHMTLRVSGSYAKGDQLVRLYVWLPEHMEAPESSIVTAIPNREHHDGRAPVDEESINIPVELQPAEPELFDFPGFTKHSYQVEGAFVDLRIKHLVKVDIVDPEGNPFNYERYIGGESDDLP